MSPLIRDIVAMARKTFSRSQGDSFEDSMRTLKSLLAQLKAADIGLAANDLLFPRSLFYTRLPVKFMDIHAEDDFTITAFVVSPNQQIPLHDHPDMYGLIKCIAGKIRVTSYSRLPADRPYVVPAIISSCISATDRVHLIPCAKQGDVEAVAEDESVLVLTPDRGNIHEVRAEDGSSGFVDVLAPPYSQESDCRYFRVIGSAVDRSSEQEICWLLPVHPPSNYWTQVIPYRGPNVV